MKRGREEARQKRRGKEAEIEIEEERERGRETKGAKEKSSVDPGCRVQKADGKGFEKGREHENGGK